MKNALFLLSVSLWAQPYDMVLTGGRIVDGAGNPWYAGDIALRSGRIAKIAPPGVLKDPAPRLDVRGLVVAPGFIDIQSHARATILSGDGVLHSKIMQGITTEIFGEGTTNAPSNAKTRGAPEDAGDKGRFDGPRGFDLWLRAMQERGSSSNFGSFVGAGTIRAYGKGMAMGPATPAELAEMKQALANAMKDGAFGLASALIYPPGAYAATPELIELAKVIAPFGGVYISHIRSEGARLVEAIDEAIEIGEKAGVPVEIYHLKAVGRENWNKMPAAVARINAARARGLDVQANMYSYEASGTGLTTCVPPWTAENGKLYENLANPALRSRLLKEMTTEADDWESRCLQAGPGGVLLVGLRQPDNKRFVGKRLSEAAAALGKPWPEAVLHLLTSEKQRIATIFFVIDENNIRAQLREPWIKISTDAGAANPATDRSPVHPRTYGTYPRVLGKYVRDEKIIPLEDAIRKMSGAVAARLSISDRGLVREGFAADLVVFDPATVADRATFDQPHQFAAGVRHVFVNGTAVVSDGKVTGAKPGRIVRGPGYSGEQARQP
jgi:dihydroorotase/N-acyl-D-amino-acid deacylase